MRFPRGGLLEGFSVFHEARRHGPEAASWLDAAPAQEDLPFVFGDTAHDEAGILVVDRPAGIADVSRYVVARWNAKFDLGAALVTKIHGSALSIPRTKRWTRALSRGLRHPPSC